MNCLFVFGFDESLFEVKGVSSFKDAIRQAAEYTGCNSELFLKSLNGFEETDVDGIIKLFNHFSQSPISKVYWFDKEPYDTTKKERE